MRETALPGLTTRAFGRVALCPKRVDSTNRMLKERGGALPHGTVCYTDRQEAGRGRLGRTWVAAPGDALALSLLIKPAEPSPVLPLVCGLAVSRALEGLCGGAAFGVKWPNDIVCAGRKVCGILCETVWIGEGWTVAGIGVNRRQDARDFERAGLAHAGSLRMLTGCEPGGREIAAAVLNELEALWDRLRRDGFAPLRPAYEARCVTIGQEVRVLTPEGAVRLEGRADGVGDDGRLRVLAPDGPHLVDAGEVSVRGARGYV